jgi:hypothetical protein
MTVAGILRGSPPRMKTNEHSTRGGSLHPSRPADTSRARTDEDAREATLDETIEDTFPASDPPSSIPDPVKPPPKSRDDKPEDTP